MDTAYVSPDAPLIRRYAGMLKCAGFDQESKEVLSSLQAGESGIALDEAMCYIEVAGIEVPLALLEMTKDILDDDGYGILACQRLIDNAKNAHRTL